MSSVRLFYPVGIKPDDYRHKFPELSRTEEFNELSARALIFVWWFSNATSPLVLDISDDYERVTEALKKSGFNPSKVERDNILKLQFDSVMSAAIKKMSSFDPGLRFRSYKIVRIVFDEYEKLIKRGPTEVAIVDSTDDEDLGKDPKNPYYTDRYVVTSNRIVDALPGLLAKLEEGFGVMSIDGNETQDEESSTIHDWHKNKADNEN